MLKFNVMDLLYENPLAKPEDVREFRMEGDGAVSFPLGRMRLESKRAPEEGQKANLVYWCPMDFPDHILVSWDFYPIREPGLAIMFFAARGLHGEDLFDPALTRREGIYSQYFDGDINTLHISYFRRRYPGERAFTTCNLRKSKGGHLVAQGADPIPSIPDADPPYHIELLKAGPHVVFSIRHKEQRIECLSWYDDQQVGPVLGSGKIGFRQMAPLIAEYANLRVSRVELESGQTD
ncbi:MAG: DUF1961 family protein [Lentisphaerae bacterium]|nr:MAG: DUF1961 family protein [Lentisphaerota bacterium]